ncbi:DUF3078 domain-containing protein [Kaistella flava (ex Peng et al. 2021)]|uniref:DUF3078 domain-containing protein n=1 Tax=Kaistella flava (ex Peng et al. 2021) TaxID=2038776 RepID=A0A7M2Y9T9_9FLAO|nr:DUF3078 domain-containing protein [Kaistella flava (ex Peng et al. 2021)]QOW11037.1 DUF3078 domain-containing protein [Kaistella flava (ex Peng et al. 2021)]
MRKLFTVIISLVSLAVFSQKEKNVLGEIDSISQKRWNATALNLDSLANPKLEKFAVLFKDTIVIRDRVKITESGDDIPVTPYNILQLKDPIKWFYYGQNNLVFNQSAFSNWNSGGNNNIGVIGKINYTLSYKNKRHFLDNNIQLGYGFVSSQGEASRKTEDYINLMTNYGYDIGRNFYLSTGFQFLSQFSTGYNYSLTPNPSFEDRISRFMSPGYVYAGVGILYNPNENFQVIFRPVNGKFTFVMDPLLQQAGRYGLEKDGQSVRSEIGALVNVVYRLKIYKDINLVNQLNLFSNYAFHPERVDIAYNGTLNFKFNKFINTVISLDLLYDHDQMKKLQLKQTLGVGFSYNFGYEVKEKNKKMIKPFVN